MGRIDRTARFILRDNSLPHQIRITVNARTYELLVRCSCGDEVLLGRKRLDAKEAIEVWRGHVERAERAE